MKRYRSALMAGLLALAVAVCDDEGTVVQPPPVVNVSPPDVTVTVPPAPPVVAPLQVTIQPPSAEVGIGRTVDFAIGTIGGSGDASWTCTSSETTVATVEMTATGCRATTVAGGVTQITAAVTKGGEGPTNVAANLTVSTAAGAFIVVDNISGEGGTDKSGLKGRVDVDVRIERGNHTFERLSLEVDGMEVDFQDFGTAAADDAEQNIWDFTLSFDSDHYEEHGDHTDVAYMNGDHMIQVMLKLAGMDELISSGSQDVVFDNDDGYVVTADLGEYSMLDDDGLRWYGGPANGHIVISALAVSYSGAETGAVAISLAGCKAEPYEGDNGDDHGSGDDDHAATDAAFEFDCEGEDAGRAIMVTEGGSDANVLNDLPVANIDMEGPAMAPYFSPNPNNRQNGWVNQMVAFNMEQTSDNENGWLTFNDEGADDAGVGGYMAVLRYAEADNGSVEDAIAAMPLSLTNFPGESAMDAYCVVVSAADNLGNESGLPDEDDGECLMAGVAAVIADDGTVTTPATTDSYEALLETLRAARVAAAATGATAADTAAVGAAEDALADAGLLAGLDITPPGIEIDEDMRINVAANLSFDFDIYDDENDVANSGLHSVAPLLARIQRRTTDDTECLDISVAGVVDNDEDESCTGDPNALGDVAITLDTDATNAYYTLSGAALDQAGNHSMVAMHTFVFDEDAASATAPAQPGAIGAGESFQIASFLNDDLSIREYYVTADFAGGIALGLGLPTMVDAFNADMLTHRNKAISVEVDTYAGVTAAIGTAAEATTGVTVAVRDQAQQGADEAARHTKVPALLTVDDPASGDNFTDNFTAMFALDSVCVAEDEDDCGAHDDRESELEVVATASADGAFSDPFERVDFWMQDVNGDAWFLGSDTSGDSGRVGGTGADARRRTWTYSMEFSAAMLYMMTREAGFTPTEDSDEHTVRAFAVNDDGVALALSAVIDIDDGENDQ